MLWRYGDGERAIIIPTKNNAVKSLLYVICLRLLGSIKRYTEKTTGNNIL